MKKLLDNMLSFLLICDYCLQFNYHFFVDFCYGNFDEKSLRKETKFEKISYFHP